MLRAPTLAGTTVLAMLSILSTGCSAGPRDIVLVTADTLRADRLGLAGAARDTTPQLDRWFADGAVYERSYSATASTAPSVVSLLSGTLPQEHGVRLLYQRLDDEARLVTDLLPSAYQRIGVVSNVVLNEEALGLSSRFDHYDDYVDERESRRAVWERNAARTTDAALRWVREQADPDRPVFLWVHYIDPHGPYRTPPEWEQRFDHPAKREIDPERIPAYVREPDQDDGLHYVDRYDDEVAYLDAEIGRLLDELDASRPLDEALVVFTADHGESLMEHERWFTHGYHVFEEIVRVPLALRGPGVPAGRFSTPVSAIDVAPTLLHFAGARVPASLRGFDLRRPAEIPADRAVYVEAVDQDRTWRAAVQGQQKWLVRLSAQDPVGRSGFQFDLERDPEEQAPRRWGEDPAGRTGLRALIASDPDPAGVPTEYRHGLRPNAPKVAPRFGPEAEQRLRALGYVE